MALLASLLVSLTVIPVLAYWFLKTPDLSRAEAEAVREEAELRELRSPLQRVYLPVLRFATKRRFVTLLIGLVVFMGTMGLAPSLKTNFLDDSGNNTIQVTQQMPAGTDLASTDAAAKKIEAVLGEFREVESYQVTVGGGNQFMGGLGGSSDRASYSVTLDEAADAVALQESLRTRLADLTDVGEVTIGGGGTGFSSDQIQVILKGADPAALKSAATTVRDALGGIDGLRDVTSNLQESAPRIEVHVDREKAAARGLTETGIGQLVAQAFRGAPIGRSAWTASPVTSSCGVAVLPPTWPRSRTSRCPRPPAWSSSARSPRWCRRTARCRSLVRTGIAPRPCPARPTRRTWARSPPW